MQTLESKPNQTQEVDDPKLEQHENKKKIEVPERNLPSDDQTTPKIMDKMEEPKQSLLLTDGSMKKKKEDEEERLLNSLEQSRKIIGTDDLKQEEKSSERKLKIGDLRENSDEIKKQRHQNRGNSLVWDCGSSLYDSFELNSFQRQLDSALISASSARTLSMPHVRSAAPTVADALPPPPPNPKNKKNKISRSLQKLLKSIFKLPKHGGSLSSSPVHKAYGGDMDRYYVVYGKSGALTTIPEATEADVAGPEIMNPIGRRTLSERFTATRTVSISCA